VFQKMVQWVRQQEAFAKLWQPPGGSVAQQDVKPKSQTSKKGGR